MSPAPLPPVRKTTPPNPDIADDILALLNTSTEFRLQKTADGLFTVTIGALSVGARSLGAALTAAKCIIQTPDNHSR